MSICHVTWKPGFLREEHTSSKCQTPSNVSICPLGSDTPTICSPVDEDDQHADETLPESWDWTKTTSEVKMLDVDVVTPGL